MVVMIVVIYIYWTNVPGAMNEHLTNISFNYNTCLI